MEPAIDSLRSLDDSVTTGEPSTLSRRREMTGLGPTIRERSYRRILEHTLCFAPDLDRPPYFLGLLTPHFKRSGRAGNVSLISCSNYSRRDKRTSIRSDDKEPSANAETGPDWQKRYNPFITCDAFAATCRICSPACKSVGSRSARQHPGVRAFAVLTARSANRPTAVANKSVPTS